MVTEAVVVRVCSVSRQHPREGTSMIDGPSTGNDWRNRPGASRRRPATTIVPRARLR